MTTFSLAMTLSTIGLFFVLACPLSDAWAKEGEIPTSMREDDSCTHPHTLLQRQIKQLQEYLPVGHSESFYRDRLVDRGWIITAINQDEPMYIEYEIVRGNLTAEVQMKLDRETDQTIQVAVLENPILREATEIELAWNQRMAQLAEAESEEIETTPWWNTTKGKRHFTFTRDSEIEPHQSEQWRTSSHADRTFSDRDRIRIDRVMEDAASLPLGQRRGFYRSALEQQGYEILATRTGPMNHVQFKAVKDQQPVLLTVIFDDDMKTSVALSAVPGRRTSSQTAKMARVEKEEHE